MTIVSLWRLLIVVIEIICLTKANWITGNLCWSMPCLNGGSCFGSAYTYLCICPINYSGVLCEKRLGVCQENPCGNRGLCVETSLTSFECRCYFGYSGSTCEEHVSKEDPHTWSSLLPTHTRLLFDMLQDAYQAKSNEKPSVSVDHNQIDFVALLTTNEPTSDVSMATDSASLTHQSETTEIEHIITAQNVQLEKIFFDVTTVSTLGININESSEQYDNLTTFLPDYETNITSTSMIIDNVTATTMANEQLERALFNTANYDEFVDFTEQVDPLITSTSVQWMNGPNIIDIENFSEDTTTGVEYDLLTITQSIDFTADSVSIKTNDSDLSYPSDQVVTLPPDSSISTKITNPTTNVSSEQSQLLHKLCQQVLSYFSLNTSSPSDIAAVPSLTLSDSLLVNNKTVDTLLSWLRKHFSSPTSPIQTSTVSSSVLSGIRITSVPLQRVDLDDVLHQMNNNMDTEH